MVSSKRPVATWISKASRAGYRPLKRRLRLQAVCQLRGGGDRERRAGRERIEHTCRSVQPRSLHARGFGSNHVEWIGRDKPNTGYRSAKPFRGVLVHPWRRLIDTDLVDADQRLKPGVQARRFDDSVEHARRPVRENRERVASRAQSRQALADIGELLQVVVQRQESTPLVLAEIVPDCSKRIVEGLARHLLEILVALHGSESEGVLKLLQAPHFRCPPGRVTEVHLELLPDPGWGRPACRTCRTRALL